MSMCMYIARGSEAELREFAEDPEAMCGLGRRARAGFATRAGGASAKLASITDVLERRPDLREAIEGLVHRAGSQNPPGAGAMPGAGASSAVVSLFEALSGHGGIGGKAEAADRPPIVDLHKSWHMFHFLFTGRAEGGTPPGSLLMTGGEEVGEDMGYGPPRLLDPAMTATLAAFVAPLTVEELKQRLDGARMATLGIYPGFDAADAVAEYGEDIEQYLPALRDHLRAAAAVREATLVWLS